MKDIFNFQGTKPVQGLAGVLVGAKSVIADRGHTKNGAAQAGQLLSMESLDHAQRSELESAASSLHASLESHVAAAFPGLNGQKTTINAAQMKAGLYAGMLGGDIKAAAKAPLVGSVVANESFAIVASEVQGLSERRIANEAYDEQATSTSVAFSIAYNLAAARQDEFGEALFPTVVIPPDQAGLTMSIDMVMVINDAKRNISGALTNFNRFNVIRAQIHPELLQNDATNIVPVFRDESKDKFVPEALMAAASVKTEAGETISTSALALGVNVDLLAVSQTEALLASGTMDVTDSIEPAVSLKNLYLKMRNSGDTVKEIIKLPTMDLPGSAFNAAVQGNTRDMTLSFTDAEFALTGATKLFNGATATLLSGLVAGGHIVRIGIDVSGKVNLQLGNVNLYTGKLSVKSVRTTDGTELSLTSGAGKTIADLFIGAEFVGYDLDARRANLNRRQRGQMVDTTTQRQYYQVPLLPPVTVPRPHSAGDANDAKDLAALVFTTHVRTSNAAVDKLLATADLLKSVANKASKLGDKAPMLGLASWMLDAVYDEQSYVADDVVDGVKSHERMADVQASLVNMLRDMVYRMYQKSGYKPAADSQNGGMSAPPTVIIATDQVIGRYLTVTGDLRTLGDQFPVKIVTTANEKMYGKIFVTFGDFTTAEAGIPNVLHFGTMQWRPELTVILPTHRDGANSKEISVSPSFRHHVNLPILGLINVSGIADVVNQKLSVNFHTVP